MTQISYDHGVSTKKLIGETIGAFFDRAVETWRDREALVVRQQNVRWSWGELGRRVDDLAAGLLSLGLERGDRVGIWAPNRSEWTLAQFATAKAGLILVNVNPAYRRSELEYAMNKVECKALILAPALKTSNYLEITDDLVKANKLPHLRHIVRLGTEKTPGMLNFDDVAGAGGNAERMKLADLGPKLQFDDAINIQFTSGTTGHPKGATLSHHNILNNGYFVAEGLKLTPDDRLCIPVPLYHCFGMVMGNLGCLTHGATMVYPAEAFDPLATLQAVAEERCTALYGVPTMFIAQLDHPEFAKFDLKSLRTGIMAGSPCPIEVMKRVQSQMNMSEVTIAYGMTETSPVSTQCATDDPVERRVSTVGQVLPHIEIKIVDPEGKAVPRGETGEFCTRGYSVMKGYWNDAEKTSGRDRRGGLDAHRRPRDHGRAGLREYRGPPEGHGDPGRRERLSARDRGVPLQPPQNPGRPGDWRARSALRRGDLRLDQAQGRPDRHARGDPRVLQGPDRPLQDPALHRVRARIPDDHHGEDPEVRDARADDPEARAEGGEDGLALHLAGERPRPCSRDG